MDHFSQAYFVASQVNSDGSFAGEMLYSVLGHGDPSWIYSPGGMPIEIPEVPPCFIVQTDVQQFSKQETHLCYVITFYVAPSSETVNFWPWWNLSPAANSPRIGQTFCPIRARILGFTK